MAITIHPTARSYLALAASFTVATLLRSVCFNPRYPIFGRELQDNLAPIERDDISWQWIAATRLWDLTLAIYVWSRETGGHRTKTDAPLLGCLLSMLSRVPLYLVLSHHFLLSPKTLFQVLVTDLFASSAALYVISKVEPKHPAFFPSPLVTAPAVDTDPTIAGSQSKSEMIGYAIAIGTSINALYSYIAERAFMQQWIRKNVLELQVPAYLSAMKPSFAHAMKNPSIAIPVLRSDATPMTMPSHLLHNLALPILTLLLALFYLPQKSPAYLALLAFIVVAPTNALSSYNLLPLKLEAATAIGLDSGLKAAVAAFVSAWVTDDWRRPNNRAAGARTGRSAGGSLKDVTAGGQNDVVIVDKNSITFVESIPAAESGGGGEDVDVVEVEEITSLEGAEEMVVPEEQVL